MSSRPFLIDSHCHLQYLDPAEQAAAIGRARARGVEGFLVPATDLDQAETLLALCHSQENVWCAIGVHPHEAASWQSGDEARLRDLLADPKVVAVGECGLDFFYDHAPREVQAEVLREQWRVAVVAIAILSAIITPSIDPVTMLLTMAPLSALYVLSIGLAAIGQRQFERNAAAAGLPITTD